MQSSPYILPSSDEFQKQKKSFRKSARNIILSQRISRSIEAKIKGTTLKKCRLPSKAETEVRLRSEDISPISSRSVRCPSSSGGTFLSEPPALMTRSLRLQQKTKDGGNPNPSAVTSRRTPTSSSWTPCPGRRRRRGRAPA